LAKFLYYCYPLHSCVIIHASRSGLTTDSFILCAPFPETGSSSESDYSFTLILLLCIISTTSSGILSLSERTYIHIDTTAAA